MSAWQFDRQSDSGGLKAPRPAAGLVIVATPIGNLGDMTERGARALRDADIIAAEDTRTSAKLLRHLGLSTPMMPYHDHSDERTRQAIVGRIADGQCVALISDAGTPLISDPGYKLVRAVQDAGFSVTTCPGPCAAIAALSLAGLPTDRFLFAGFLPAKAGARRQALRDLADTQATLIFYESGGRLAEMLAVVAELLPGRQCAVVREITKLHEEVRQGTPAELSAQIAQDGPPRGEIVVLVGPPEASDDAASTAQTLDRALGQALESLSVREAANAVAYITGQPRKQVYQRALELTGRVQAQEPSGGG